MNRTHVRMGLLGVGFTLCVSCGGEIEAPVRTCHLSKVNPHVVDIDGEGIDYLYALMSDGTLRWWGGGYPVSAYTRGMAEPYDEPCLTSFDADSNHAGLSYRDEYTLLNFNSGGFLNLGSGPLTGKLPGDSPIVAIQGDRDFVALDEAGGVWVLWQDHRHGDDFHRLELPASAKKISAIQGFCTLLVDGTVWCYDDSETTLGRFGLGDDIAPLVDLTQLDIVNAQDFALSFPASCYLDFEGTTRCAGSSKSKLLGYPSNSFPDMERGTFEIVPGLPPLKRIWMGDYRACGLDLEDGLWCWGSNGSRQLTDSDEESIFPTEVGRFPGLKDVGMSWYTTCLLRADDKVVCRGASTGADVSCQSEDGWHVIDLEGTCAK